MAGLGCFSSSFAQTGHPSIDSLLNQAKEISGASSDRAYFYAQKAHEIALTVEDSTAIFTTEFTKASYLLMASRNEEAYPLLKELLQKKERLSDNLLADVYYHVASYFYYKEQYDFSLENYLLAIEYFEVVGNKRGKAKANFANWRNL